jgi:hypothetical protein
MACVDRAARLVGYIKAHARKVYAALHADPALEGARRVLEWLRRRPAVQEFVRENLHASLRRRWPRADQLNEPLALLVQQGYLMEFLDAKGGRRWHVNPRWRRAEGPADEADAA